MKRVPKRLYDVWDSKSAYETKCKKINMQYLTSDEVKTLRKNYYYLKQHKRKHQTTIEAKRQ